MKPLIYYRGGYKYQLAAYYAVDIDLKPPRTVHNHFIMLQDSGRLTIEEDYAWDGPSGPTIDTPSFMRGSLVHDALYQLFREKLLDHEIYRKKADQILRDICKEDGMSSIRAWWVYSAVRLAGKSSAIAQPNEGILSAP